MESNLKNQTETTPKRGKRILTVILIGLLAMGGLTAWYYYPRDTRTELIIAGPLDFTVNLADNQRYLKVTVELGYYEVKVGEEIERKKPEIRDLIINIFRTRQVAEISHLEGTDNLRREIKEEVNSRLESGKITDVYFTQFIIQ